VTFVTNACVLFRMLILLIARLEALLSGSSSLASSSSRDLLELEELRCDDDEAEELRSRSVLRIWPKIVSSWFRDFSRKVWISSVERLGRACWIWLRGSWLYSERERGVSAARNSGNPEGVEERFGVGNSEVAAG
jgi:hypothetical protein